MQPFNLTLRVDGVQVDNLEISRGESIDFPWALTGTRLPQMLPVGLGYQGNHPELLS